MNDIIFSNSFLFRTVEFDKFHHTDNRAGVPSHFFAFIILGRCKITTASETVEINQGDIFKCCYQSTGTEIPKLNLFLWGLK